MEKREMTVYRKRGTSREENNPLIMLQGKWLRDMGFSTGDRILVSFEDGKLIVERTGGTWSDPKVDSKAGQDFSGTMEPHTKRRIIWQG